MTQIENTKTSKSKVSIAGWITPESKRLWKSLADQNGMTMSSFLESMINEVVQTTEPKEGSVSVQRKKDSKSAIHVRLNRSSLEMLDRVGKKNNSSRQRLIEEAVYLFLVKRPALDIRTMQKLVSATHELNKIGINLNQTTRALNRMLKEGKFNQMEIVDKINDLQKTIPLLKDYIKKTTNYVDSCLSTYTVDNKVGLSGK